MTTQTDPTMQVLDAIRNATATTSADVQDVTGLGKSAVNRILKELTDAGTITRTPGATRFSPATYTVPQTAAEPDDDTDTDTAPDAPPSAAVADVAGWMESARPTPELTEEEKMAEEAKTKTRKTREKKEPAAPKEPRTGTCTHPGCPSPAMHKEGRSWLHDPVDGNDTFTWDHTATSRAVRVSAAPSANRRPKGGMGNEIVAFLQAHPDESFGPGAIAKGIGTQWAGTVGKQCEKLVESGHINRTAPSPGAKYQAA